MNTYNDNLHSSVVDSLHSQELDLKKTKSTLNASMFTLYYAEGEVIDANEKLILVKKDLEEKTEVKTQAVISSNISTNVLASSEQEKKLVDLSITNSAVAAANIQVAANAIVRLASDVGSIFSIVNAADFGTDIFALTKEAHEKMNKTAFSAEFASQQAMEAASYTAEVTSSIVDDKAKIADTSMQSLLKIAETEYDATSALVNSDNVALATATTVEKSEEGVLEDNNINHSSTDAAYTLTNKELNLYLRVPTKLQSDTAYTVQFNYFHAPFNIGRNLTAVDYPVEFYYIMLVKNSKKTTFSNSTAENTISKNIHLKVWLKHTPKPGNKASIPISIMDLNDTDGDALKLGDEYVVFVMATLKTRYKRAINNFEDFLSAPSRHFSLTRKLIRAQKSSISVSPYHPKTSQDLTFIVDGDQDLNVEYRCMFLPAKDLVPDNLLTAKELLLLDHEMDQLEKFSDQYLPAIEATQEEILNVKAQIATYLDELKNYDVDIPDYDSKIALLTEEKNEIEKSLSDEIHELNSTIDRAKTRETQIKATQTATNSKITAKNSQIANFNENEQNLNRDKALLEEEKKGIHDKEESISTNIEKMKSDIAGFTADQNKLKGVTTDLNSRIKKLKEKKKLTQQEKVDLKKLETDLAVINQTNDNSKSSIDKLNAEIKIQNNDLTELSAESTNIDKSIKAKTQSIADNNQKLEKAESELAPLKNDLRKLKGELENWITIIDKAANQLKVLNKSDAPFDKQIAQIEKDKSDLTNLHNERKNLKEELKNLEAILKDELAVYTLELDELKSELEKNNEGILKFYFNLELAEHIPDGSYTPVTKGIKIPITHQESDTQTEYSVPLEPETTDNFGNLLIAGKEYLPIILSVSDAQESNLEMYTNALSQVTSNMVFKYGKSIQLN